MVYDVYTVATHTSINNIVELFLSGVAIIISLAAILLELWGNQRLNKVNLESRYYDEIYKEYLIMKIPEARNKLVFNNNKILGADTLIDVLNEMRRNSIFFKFHNKKFYDSLYGKLQCLEDELVEKSDKTLENDEFCSFTNEVNDGLEKIYDIILTNYTGKKINKKRGNKK